MMNGVGQIYRMAMHAPRQPFPGVPGVPHPGGTGLVFVYDEQGLAIPLAEVYLVKVERGTLDVIEQVTAGRTDQYGKITFTLPEFGADEALVYIVEKPGYERATMSARPHMTARISLAKETGEFRPEEVVLRERIPATPMVAGIGMPDAMTDLEFLRTLAERLSIPPSEAGGVTKLWTEGKVDEFVRFISSKIALDADSRATLRSLAGARDAEGVLDLMEERKRPFFLRSNFLVPSGFFLLGLIVYPAIMRRSRRG